MKNIKLLILACSLLGLVNTTHAQSNNSKSQAGGLPALANEVAILSLKLAELEAQINDTGDPYTGVYSVSVYTSELFGGCPPSSPPNPPTISSGVALFDVVADGVSVEVPAHQKSMQRLRLNNTLSTFLEDEDSFSITIAADGSLHAETAPNELFQGQMSDDGSTFIAQLFGKSISSPGSCSDSFISTAIGVRK